MSFSQKLLLFSNCRRDRWDHLKKISRNKNANLLTWKLTFWKMNIKFPYNLVENSLLHPFLALQFCHHRLDRSESHKIRISKRVPTNLTILMSEITGFPLTSHLTRCGTSYCSNRHSTSRCFEWKIEMHWKKIRNFRKIHTKTNVANTCQPMVNDNKFEIRTDLKNGRFEV